MPQELAAITKLRDELAARNGPPNGPAAFRVSTTRHGVMVLNAIGPLNTGGALAVTVRLTLMTCGVLPAPAEVMTMAALYGPGRSPVGSTVIVSVVAVSVMLIHETMFVAIHGRLPPPFPLVMVTV